MGPWENNIAVNGPKIPFNGESNSKISSHLHPPPQHPIHNPPKKLAINKKSLQKLRVKEKFQNPKPQKILFRHFKKTILTQINQSTRKRNPKRLKNKPS